ncbi:hypothetical protein DEIPH_ctg033orf0210 [Deinococcus phoenicis]|uniref:Uncharacterized protein n=1 Tax=Deinococcus phoenicis TaxID=1476583 RepID=A0A016QNW1_9DEIO|nr:hypothetical protein DEIPH_ctg033orf0210 [Deinococcus phoenicis]
MKLTRLEDFLRSSPVTSIIRFPEDQKSAKDSTQAIVPGGTTISPTLAAPTPGTTPPLPEAPVGFAATLADLVKPPSRADFRGDDPLWVYSAIGAETQQRAPGVQVTNLGSVQSIVVLRNPYQDELDYAMPFFGPLSILAEDTAAVFKQRWNNLKARYQQSESWGHYYEPIERLALDRLYRWPLPNVTGIELRQNTDGSSVAEIEMYVDDHDAAEMLLSSLNMAQRYKNMLVEVWLPVTYYHTGPGAPTGERLVLEPMFVGMIEEVTASPWPSTLRFRVIPQDAVMNLRGMAAIEGTNFTGHWETVRAEGQVPLYQIIGDIGEAYKILFYAPAVGSLASLASLAKGGGQIGLDGYPELQVGPETFDGYMQPPLDVVRQLVEQRGLRLQRLTGFEVFGYHLLKVLPFAPRAIWLVYDPTAWNPFQQGFWGNAVWSKIFKPLAEIVAPGDDVVGNIAVFYPHNLASDPKYIKLLASTLDTFATDDARKDKLWTLVTNLQAIAQGGFGMGNGPATKAAYERGTQSVLIDWLNDLWRSNNANVDRVTKALCPVLEVESFVSRTPTESELTNPLYGTDVGKAVQYKTVSGQRAADLMDVQQQTDGTFALATPNGKKNFAAKDRVFLKYSANSSRPMTAIAALGQIEERGRFYPHTLVLQCKPTHGVRPGMMAALVGLGRIDGIWEVYSVEHNLDGAGQNLRVTLRTMRDLYAS